MAHCVVQGIDSDLGPSLVAKGGGVTDSSTSLTLTWRGKNVDGVSLEKRVPDPESGKTLRR